MGTQRLEPPREAVVTSTHNLCFGAKIRKNRYIPVYPSFIIKNWGLGGGGYTFHGHVFLMRQNGGSNIVIYKVRVNKSLKN